MLLKTAIVSFCLLLSISSLSIAEQLNVDFKISDQTFKTLGANPDATLTTMTSGNGLVEILMGGPLAPKAVGTDDPGNPIATYGANTQITGTVGFQAGNGGFYFTNSTVNTNNGSSFFARMWNVANKCYADTSAAGISWDPVLGPNPAYILPWSAATSYWAMAPVAASVAISESMQRDDNGTPGDPTDDFYNLTLTVSPVYNESSTHIQLAQTDAGGPDGAHMKYRIHCYKVGNSPDLATPTTDHRVKETNGGAVSFSGGPGPYFQAGDYAIDIYTFNWFGHGGPSSTPWSTLSGGGAGGGTTFTINISRVKDGLGLNSFSVPKANFEVTTVNPPIPALDGTKCDTALKFVDLLNKIQGNGSSKAFVRTFGYWDQVSQGVKGVVVEYNGDTIKNQAELSGIPFVPGMGYQVYVRPDVDSDINYQIKIK